MARAHETGSLAKHVAEAPTSPTLLPAGRSRAAVLPHDEAPTRVLGSSEPFARATGAARSVEAVVAAAHELFGSVVTREALAIVRRCDARVGRAPALATVATLAGVPDDVRDELRASLPAEETPHFEVGCDLARALRRSDPHAFLEAQAAVREAQRGFADGAFAALDGAPCFAGGAFAHGHGAVTRWREAAQEVERERVLREARADRDAGYWSRLRGGTVDVTRFDVSAAYRAGVLYAEHVLSSRAR